jgi:hypothetical protein
MATPDALSKTRLFDSLEAQDLNAAAPQEAGTKLAALVATQAQKYRDEKASEAYQQSPHIKKLRKLDRDRKADGKWNEQRRNEYAVMVAMENDREVREYRKDNDDQVANKRTKIASRVFKHRASLTEEQKAENRKQDALRKRLAYAAKKAAKTITSTT